MKVLHIFKSEPEKMVSDIVRSTCDENDCKVVEVFRPDVDWENLVDDIFSHNKVICWW
ncbi:hypothetical protein [Desulfonatronovibrio magnus]|uniref:hypothetical protein n=1 Tax=Desulfonatronovibrio magnus TaxID=698827 RepID=UPI0012FABA70|nr:hypothetical protein [Desulfonatronovibrio magnus]